MSETKNKLKKMLENLNMKHEKTPNFILDAAEKLIDLGYEEEAAKLLSNYKRFERNIIAAYEYGIELVQTSGISSSVAASQMLEKLIEIEKKTRTK